MKIISKVLIPNKEWIIETEQGKIGSISKNKKGYLFLQKGKVLKFKDIKDINQQFGFDPFENSIGFKSKLESTLYSIYDYSCSSKPHNPMFNLKKKLPIFSKGPKSKSQYCAGYYVIKFRKGWVKSFCPKLITLERYPYHGPFKTETECKKTLNVINQETSNCYNIQYPAKNEKTQYITD